MSKKKKEIRKPRFIQFAFERNNTSADGDSEAMFDGETAAALSPPQAPEESPSAAAPIVLMPETEIPLDHAEDPEGVAEESSGDAVELEEAEADTQIVTACKKRSGEWWLFTMDATGEFQPTDGPFPDRESCEIMRPDRDTNMTDRLP